MSPRPFRIVAVSDAVCPWCFIGKRSLERAAQQLPRISLEVRWEPFFLDPALPREGLPYADYMRAKYGGGSSRVRAQIEAAGSEVGIDFRFERIQRRPHTLDAHRVTHWAEHGAQQNAVVDALFRAHFERGDDIGDRPTLARIAAGAGMDGDAVRVWLEEGRDAQEVEARARRAIEEGVTGVPSFQLAGRIAIPGAQDPATYARLIERVARLDEPPAED